MTPWAIFITCAAALLVVSVLVYAVGAARGFRRGVTAGTITVAAAIVYETDEAENIVRSLEICRSAGMDRQHAILAILRRLDEVGVPTTNGD